MIESCNEGRCHDDPDSACSCQARHWLMFLSLAGHVGQKYPSYICDRADRITNDFFCLISGKAINKVTPEGRRSSFWPSKWRKVWPNVQNVFKTVVKWWHNSLWLWKIENWSCHCSHMMCRNIKRAEGSESFSRPHKDLSDPMKDMGVYLKRWLRVCVRCVQQVCSSTQKALSQPQGCVCAAAWGHSNSRTEQGFFSSPGAEWRVRCVPLARLESPPFLCAQPIPPIPSFSSLFPKTKGDRPISSQ